MHVNNYAVDESAADMEPDLLFIEVNAFAWKRRGVLFCIDCEIGYNAHSHRGVRLPPQHLSELVTHRAIERKVDEAGQS